MELKPKIIFFGTPEIAVKVINELDAEGIIPDLVVTNPDRQQGRGLKVSPPPVKEWAAAKNIPVLQPLSLLNEEELDPAFREEWDLFVVVAYGMILPKWFIELPKYGTINLHPSLLPKLRGASPIRTSILEGMKDTGVTVMLMDEKMDHGAILAQEAMVLPFPIEGQVLDEALAQQGGKLLASVIPRLLDGKIVPKEQDHTQATYSKKITKEMGELALDPFNLPRGKEAYDTYLKICAFDGWPGTYFFYNNKRIKVTQAFLSDEPDAALEIYKVIPEGKKEISFKEFLNQVKS
jgi:methionyl-tRNA formyltransferase